MKKLPSPSTPPAGHLLHTLAAAVLLLYHTVAAAQPLSTFTPYSTEMGFVQKEVMQLAQDDKGLMWFATWDGLYCFDGHRFNNYKARPGDGVRMESNRLVSICIDGDFVWMQGYNGSISCFNNQTKTIQDLPLNIYMAKDICHDPHGGVIVNTTDNRLIKAVMNSGTHKISITHITGHGHSKVNKVATSHDGTIYVMTDNGLFACNHRQKTLKRIYKGLSFNDMDSSETRLVFGGDYGTLLVGHNGHWQARHLPTRAAVTSVALLSDGRIAAAYHGGLAVLNADGSIHRLFTTANSPLNSDTPGALNKDSYDNLWFCTGKPGVMRYDSHADRLYHLQMPGEFGTIDSQIWMHDVKIAETSKGDIWVSPASNGLAYFDRQNNRLIPYFDHNKQQSWTAENTMVDVFVDNQDNLWFCGKYTGLEKVTFNTRQFFTLDMQCDTESGNDVRGIFQDRNGYIWIGAKNGIISVFDPKMRHVGNLSAGGQVKPGCQDKVGRAYSFAQDKTGTLWIGTKFGGLLRLQPRGPLSFTLTRFTADASAHSLVHNDIFDLEIDRHQRLWIATYGGGLCYLPLHGQHGHNPKFISVKNRLTTYPKDKCLKARCITADKTGNIWVGTTSGLLTFNDHFARPEDIRFQRYIRQPDDAQSLSYNDVLEVFATHKGQIYVCTYGGGFCHITKQGNKRRFKSFTTTNGLRSDVIFSAGEDRRGHLWFATENALVRYDPTTEKIETFTSRFFGKHVDINEGKATTLHDGRLMFPCRNHGAVYFNPDNVKVSDFVPPLILTRLFLQQEEITPATAHDLLDTDINLTTKLVLSHHRNSIGIEFAALDYRDPDNINYAYRMEGIDDHWVVIGNTHHVTFNNLQPGSYTLMLRSTNSDGVWTNNVRTLQITVSPSFWQTPWAWLLYLLAAIGIIAASTYILFTIFRLKQKVRMEKHLSDLKLKFFTDISHEIRTPLTLISGTVKELLRSWTGDKETQESLTVVNNNANRLLRLVNQILDIRKTANGKMHLSLRQVDISQCVQATAANFKNIAHEQHIQFEVNTPEEPLQAWADSDALDKIVFNLLSNAMRFTPSGKRVIVGVQRQGSTASITVTDQGPGIATSHIDDIFKPFVSAESQGAMKQRGTGIGLTLAKELVELHQGHITVHSTPGVGSTFTVTLPIDGGMDHYTAGIPEPAATETDSRRATILIVEDNKEMRDFIKKVLRHQYNVIEAANGAEGIDKAQSHTPDIIITDYMMPVTDGMEMSKQLRTQEATNHIPIIMLSAKTDDDSKIHGMETGIDDYMEKPFSADLLRARLNNIMARQENMRRYFREKYLSKAQNEPTQIKTGADSMNFMSRLNAILEQNISNGDLTVDDVASQLNMSRSVYFKKLKALTGLSPNEFLKMMRMKRAAELIDTNQYSINEISMMVGINDSHYFSKCFKQHFHMTPTEWKKRT